MKNNYIIKITKKLANLQLAIFLLFIIGFIIAIGTLIEQDQALNFYKENYSEINPLFGFLNWKIITFLSFDHIYTAWWFLVILFLFAVSLLSCTFTTQLPSIKTFKIWRFFNSPKQFKTVSIKSSVELGCFNAFAYHCNSNNYHFFRQSKKGYAYSGLLGRVAPAVVHISIVLLLLGSTLGSLSGYTAQQFIPRGEITHIQNLTKFGNLSSLTQDFSFRVNDFWITYTKDLKTDQFYSDLSLLTNDGKELKRKTIFVNEPLIFDNIVLYQTDWDIVGLKLKVGNGEIFQIPLKKITKDNRKFWFCSIPISSSFDKKISIIINDLNGQIFVYDSKGLLLKQTNLGSNLSFEDSSPIQFLSFLTTTGLQIKSDPGIQTVYLSFLFLMLSVYISFFTYSQIWLIETPKKTTVGGNSNRAVLFFQQEFRKIAKQVKRSI